jgi:hypothetical protein
VAVGRISWQGEPLTSEDLRIEFAGEWYSPSIDQQFVIGREGDLIIDDNPYLHRTFLRLAFVNGLWWVINEGSRIPATLADGDGKTQSWLAPGSQIPLVFPHTCLTFAAGSTTYEVNLFIAGSVFSLVRPLTLEDLYSGETIGAVQLTPSQKLCILALAETRLRRLGSGTAEVPSSAEAAARLGWSHSKFTRKLDNVCDKFSQIGVEGLHGGFKGYAVNRRLRLVEYAVTAQIVTINDVPLLDAEFAVNRAAAAKRDTPK